MQALRASQSIRPTRLNVATMTRIWTSFRRASRPVLAMLIVVVATLSAGHSVTADTGFSGSTPSNGDVVAEPVELVTLAFTSSAEPVGDGFVVLDADGQQRTPTAVSTLDNKLYNLRFEPPLAGGEIGVRWSVLGADGHPLDGSFSFTVTASPEAETAATTTPVTTITAGIDTATNDGAAVADAGDTSTTSAEEMASMDDFLAVDSTRPGDTQARLGRLISFAGIALALGAIAFAATTLRGEAIEIRSLVNTVRALGVFITVGALIEYGGVASIAGESLTGYWSSSPGFATVLRMLAGIAIAAGLTATTAGVRSGRKLQPLSAAPNTTDGRRDTGDFWGVEARTSRRQPVRQHTSEQPAGHSDGHGHGQTDDFTDPGLTPTRRRSVDDSFRDPALRTNRTSEHARPLRADVEPLVEPGRDASIPPDRPEARSRRWVPDRSSAIAFVGCGAAVVSFWFDGHTVSKGFRPLHAVANSVHVIAGSVWLGGVVAMAILLWARHRRGVAPGALDLVVRFSSVATVALAAVVVAGLIMAVSVLDSFGGLTGSQWGQVLLLKTAAAGLALVGGAYNHYRLLPALEAAPDDAQLHEQVRSVVTAEAIMLSFVVIVTASLVASAT